MTSTELVALALNDRRVYGDEPRDDGRLFNPAEYVDATDPHRRALYLAYEFVAGYENRNTMRGHAQVLREWIEFLQYSKPDLDPVSNDVRRADIDLYKHWLRSSGKAPATIARKLSCVVTWYRSLIGDGNIDRDPSAGLRRPKVPEQSTRPYLDPRELADFLNLAQREARDTGTPMTRSAYAMACLFCLNGLRVSAVLGADVDDLRIEQHVQQLRVVEKGPVIRLVPLVARTSYAIAQAVGDRTEGPICTNRRGKRMDRESAGRIVRRLAANVAPGKNITPHGLRHSAITALSYAGADVRKAQTFAGHADPRTTERYIRRTDPPEAHGTFLLAGSLASYPVYDPR